MLSQLQGYYIDISPLSFLQIQEKGFPFCLESVFLKRKGLVKDMNKDLKTSFQELSIKEQQSRIYFASLAIQSLSIFKMHRAIGLWERKEGKDEQVSWRNVSEHCLIEMARVKVFAKLLKFSEALQKDLLDAAALHDFYKEQEIKILKAEGSSWASFSKASEQAIKIMKAARLSERVIRLANAVGHSSLQETVQILQEEQMSEEQMAFLVMHFVDDTTRDTRWAEPSIKLNNNTIINDLDRRMEKNEKNLLYRPLNEEGRKIFNGETTFQAQRRIGHLVEDRLADLLFKRAHRRVYPRDLSEFIDDGIRTAVSSVRLKRR